MLRDFRIVTFLSVSSRRPSPQVAGCRTNCCILAFLSPKLELSFEDLHLENVHRPHEGSTAPAFVSSGLGFAARLGD